MGKTITLRDTSYTRLAKAKLTPSLRLDVVPTKKGEASSLLSITCGTKRRTLVAR
jgi:predicted CopG family antitoxin